MLYKSYFVIPSQRILLTAALALYSSNYTFYSFIVKPILLLACLGLSISVQAQRIDQDYLVTASGDTLHGRVLVSEKGVGHVTLKRRNTPSTRFEAAELLSFGDQKGVISQTLPVGSKKTPQLVTPLVQGPVSLYGGRGADGKKGYFLQSPDSAYLVQVVPDAAQLTLHRLLPGCPTLEFGTTKVQQKYPVNYSGLTRLTMDYNACRHPQESSKILKRSSGIRAVYGIKAGINASDFEFASEPFPGSSENQIGYQAGVFLRLFNKSRFSTIVEANYLSLRNTYRSVTATSSFSQENEAVVDYQQIQIPLLLRYTLGSGIIRPYINAGVLYGHNLRNSSVETRTTSSTSTVIQKRPILITKSGVGWTAGLGTTIQRKNLPELGLEARYEQTNYNGFVIFNPIHTSARLDVSIGF
ncbi:porin family protein [Hymenobacter perfusus]|uniref:PorT family protein n=1 Tax=Hymenobacter perfusus TaxID=1236770 RepID=A0A428KCZ0_9BACT|nr:porin family protein [Hymenobacter perfusus]RSK44281.1 PorT family protein [Hymenobacter perfusus]